MHDPSCRCSAHDPNGRLERSIQAAIRANSAKLWAIRGIDARIKHSADQMTLDRLAADSGLI